MGTIWRVRRRKWNVIYIWTLNQNKCSTGFYRGTRKHELSFRTMCSIAGSCYASWNCRKIFITITIRKVYKINSLFPIFSLKTVTTPSDGFLLQTRLSVYTGRNAPVAKHTRGSRPGPVRCYGLFRWLLVLRYRVTCIPEQQMVYQYPEDRDRTGSAWSVCTVLCGRRRLRFAFHPEHARWIVEIRRW